MANFNKVILFGRLTRDPQLSYTPSQTAIVEFGLAINRNWTGKDGQKKEETCFVNCKSFGKQAETINKYLTKGRPVFIEGRLSFSSWEAQDGSKRSKLEVVVENFQFISSGGGGGAKQAAQAPAADNAPGDDDIPF